MKPSWRQIMLAFWVLLSGLATTRFLASFARGFYLVRGSVAAANPGLYMAISEALTRLGITAKPELRTSHAVRCPSVWCWGRQPILLVPALMHEEDSAIDWVAIFCHELAHWRRLDHMACLGGEILVCVLPWSPLAWWARTRLAQLGELACDDWVLACGSTGTEYAASLLELLSQRGPRLASARCRATAGWSAVSSTSSMSGAAAQRLERAGLYWPSPSPCSRPRPWLLPRRDWPHRVIRTPRTRSAPHPTTNPKRSLQA